MAELCEVPLSALAEVLEKLAEKRIAVEKEVIKYGEAPAGLRDVFELCRGFERAFVNTINYGDASGPQFKKYGEENGAGESPTALNIKEAFSGENGLQGAIRDLPYDDIFSLENVKRICRQADGFYPHLVSPEKGLRQLAGEALDLVQLPVQQCLSQVYGLLVAAAKEAIAQAGKHTEAALLGAAPMNIPDFKTMALPAIVAALDDWRAETEKVLAMLVDQERTYITAGFFRHTMNRRIQRQQQQQAMAQAAQGAKATRSAAPGAAQTTGPVQQQQQSGLSARLAQLTGKTQTPPPAAARPAAPPPPTAQASGDGSDSEGEDDRTPARKPGAPATLTAGNYTISGLNPADYLAGFFDKYTSNDVSRSGLPDVWKWQKRFFIFSDSQKTLYYFKGPDEVPKPNGLRGQFGVADCLIEDLDERGNLREGPPKTTTSTLIRIRPKDPLRSIIKDHKVVYLKAETVQQKIDWLMRMRDAVMGKKPAPVKKEVKPEVEKPVEPTVQDSGSVEEQPLPEPEPTPVRPQTLGQNLQSLMSFSIEDAHGFGQGAGFFSADSLRDKDGRLLPAPNPVLSAPPLAPGSNKDVAEAYELCYDRLMDQFGRDLDMYIRMISDTIIITVPKAIVHCMVRKAEKNMLERLFAHVHKLSPMELQRLLAEDPEVVQLRSGARQILEALKSAYFEVQQLQEKETLKGAEDKKEKLLVSTKTVALAGLSQFLSPEQVSRYTAEFSAEHFPKAVKLEPPPKPAPVEPVSSKTSGAAPAAPQAVPSGGAPSPAVRSAGPGGPGVVPSGPSGTVPRRAPPPPAGVQPATSVRRAPPPPPPSS